MSRRHKSMRSPLALTVQVLACFAAVLALAGCGAGQVTQTDTQVAAIDGANANLGSVALRDVLITYSRDRTGNYPPGSNVPLQLTLVNEGTGPDTLASVTTPVASQVLLQGTTTIPPGTSVTTPRETGVGPSATPSAPPSPLDAGLLRIVLTNTTQTLWAGKNVDITFVFRHAGRVTLSVPLGAPSDSVSSPAASRAAGS